jgi:hypothetical protein
MPNKKVVPQLRNCEQCDAEFLVGGRGRKRSKARFCSKRCSALARVKQPTLRTFQPIDAAYIAGVFDGEGSIILWDRGYGGRPQLRATVSNTYFPLLERIREMAGSGSIVRKVYPSETGYRDAGTWQVYGQNAVSLLEQLLPYLIVKREKAITAIESQRSGL